ncbi:hypothetical protein GCM10010532_081660 [Dactylosporangium siamense]|uniref:Secreted protein n=2 Tax=Dactylosporangium siamense TaxID=685454 RepID=A0A919UEV2_9ACTN|nr:hypothetical protein Dsi01nite_060390 [Dactylosporangium siamense]
MRLAAVVFAGASVLAAPTSAEAASSSIAGSYAYDLDASRTVTVCDVAPDSKKVRAIYGVRGYLERSVENDAGNGQCRTSAYEPEHIFRFKACRNAWVDWYCATSYAYTGY